MQSSDNLVPQTAPPQGPPMPRYDKFKKDSQIDHFLRFFKGGTKAKLPKKLAGIWRLDKSLALNPPSANQYAPKVQSSDKLVPQTALPQMPEMPSYDKFKKDT